MTCDLEDMVRDLERVCKDTHGDESEDESKDESDSESKTEKVHPMFTKQFKGMCRKCGQMGHKARDCENKEEAAEGSKEEVEDLAVEAEVDEAEASTIESSKESATTVESADIRHLNVQATRRQQPWEKSH